MRFKSFDELRKTKVGSLPINAAALSLGAPQAPKRERDTLSTLVQNSSRGYRRKASVAFCITIVSFRHTPMDDNNLSAGTGKNFQDSIAASLGIDDRDPRVKWEWRQVITDGAEGTQVLISTMSKRRMRNAQTISKGAENPARAS